MKTNIRGVIFDLDGTLLDSLEDIADMANSVLSAHGYKTHSKDEYKQFVGYGSRELFVRATFGQLDDATIDTMRDEYEEIYTAMPSNKSTIYDGVAEVLSTLLERDYKVAILSNKPHDLTLKCVNTFLPQFQFHAVFGEIRGINRKPDPVGALNIAKLLELEADEIAFVGDTKVDMQTAKNAGMYAIGVTWGFRDRMELENNGADTIIDTPSQLLSALEKR